MSSNHLVRWSIKAVNHTAALGFATTEKSGQNNNNNNTVIGLSVYSHRARFRQTVSFRSTRRLSRVFGLAIGEHRKNNTPSFEPQKKINSVQKRTAPRAELGFQAKFNTSRYSKPRFSEPSILKNKLN